MMSAYLARLKQLETEKNSHHIPNAEPTKPAKVPFGGFDGMGTGHIEKNIDEELRLLIPAVVRTSGDDAAMEAYCLKIALADPVDALSSYRLLAAELGIEPSQLSAIPFLRSMVDNAAKSVLEGH